ncbi:hypothetical protein SUGI_0102710 [Cryptomeria japonica]|nr:hypothetical protein SUGI_0102710 [Cryptomeria japonica]
MIRVVLLAIPIYNIVCFKMSHVARRKLDGLLKKFVGRCQRSEEDSPNQLGYHVPSQGRRWSRAEEDGTSKPCVGDEIDLEMNIITDHISWCIGNGHMAMFWSDSWEGEQVLGDLFAE